MSFSVAGGKHNTLSVQFARGSSWGEESQPGSRVTLAAMGRVLRA